MVLQGEEKKKLLCGMLMTASDVSAIAKPWELQHETAKMVADEFFDQGDMERMKLNITPMVRMISDPKKVKYFLKFLGLLQNKFLIIFKDTNFCCRIIIRNFVFCATPQEYQMLQHKNIRFYNTRILNVT